MLPIACLCHLLIDSGTRREQGFTFPPFCATDAAHIVEMTEVEMRQDQHVSFRASAPIVDALALRAAKAGCSISEYLRAVVRENVGLQ